MLIRPHRKSALYCIRYIRQPRLNGVYSPQSADHRPAVPAGAVSAAIRTQMTRSNRSVSVEFILQFRSGHRSSTPSCFHKLNVDNIICNCRPVKTVNLGFWHMENMVEDNELTLPRHLLP